jgi:hypothetical protein
MTIRPMVVVAMLTCVVAGQSCSSPSEPSGGSLAGSWTGTLFQPGNTNNNPSFPYRMELTQSGSQISGTAHIERLNESQYFADFAVTGSLIGSTFTFQETRISRENPPPGAIWCLKNAALTFTSSPRALAGPWTSTICVNPGTIELH